MFYDPTLLGLEVHKRTGDEFLVTCPYHHDTHPSARFNAVKGLFICFACGAKRNHVQLAKELDGEIHSYGGVSVEKYFKEDDYDWAKYLSASLAVGNEYLVSRSVGSYSIINHDIRNYKDGGVIFPVKNLNGDESGVIIRQLKSSRKYLLLGDMTPVWPIENLKKKGKIYIVEGPFGVLRAESCGLNAVATLGTQKITNVLKLFELNNSVKNRVMAIMDPDESGRKAALQLANGGIKCITKHKRCCDEWSDKNWLFVDSQTKI